MMPRIAILSLALAAVVLMAPTRPAAGVTQDATNECNAVAALGIADVEITSSSYVGAGAAWGGPSAPGRMPQATASRSFCRVQGTIEKAIAFELWLPTRSGWNGKYLGAGVGGAAGTFNYNDLPRGVSRGYAAATTDTGHKIDDPRWMLDQQARNNYTHRANHLLAVKSKAIIAAFYGSGPKRSYFIGCSGGGRQGLKEMQLYPEDYDGIISGANGPRTPEMTTRRMWEITQRDANPGLMKPEDWQLIANAGMKACSPQNPNGSEDPRVCRFSVAQLQCSAGQSKQCLSAEQVRFASRFYAPLTDSTGRAIDRGILPGVLVDGGRSQLALATFGQAIRKQSTWNGEGFDVARDLAAIDHVMPQLRADTTDVSAFRKRGGKLIMYTGWMDGAVAARMVTDYHDALVTRAGGPAAANRFERLYMLPGVYHCAGGPGADQIGGAGRDAPIPDARHDMLTALEQWVEHGQAPGDMIASKVEDGRVTRTHLICAYPKRARFVGGDRGKSESYTCG